MSEPVTRALVVVAHPDDVDFGAAGTVASWTAAGIAVSYCLVTSGDAGGFDDTPRSEMAGLREAEQRAAAAELGVTDLTFLRYPDGEVTPSLALRRDISRVVRRVRPHRVLTQSPEMFWERIGVSHPDHRATGEATLAAVYPDARNPFAYPELLADEGLEAWAVPETWVAGCPPERVNHVVDVGPTLSAKFAALRAHRSQTAHRDDLETLIKSLLARNRERYAALAADGVEYVEAFQVVDTA
ncbi:LmbE family N-acetylglucosaminyl deacetylase [Actinomycetospora succinea]|uniref:LmbE family N-acetylglucosaminyl deacetylase n=1 Tax=Actinomycetospora succinea TaxID=663603 RepID=A0A4R6VJX7_9PSEU|nr:PIG-L deacetylase family protein [Actinomycetospora succinea]TDQ58839.1 LmbE family N-acetylglucosaminyl deacetylase [Actinomycetospora succinea]